MTWDRSTLVQLSLSVVVAFALALFIHDSGSSVFSVVQIGVHAVFLPFLIAVALCYVAEPLVTLLEVKGVRRLTAIFLLYGSLLVLAAAFSAVVYAWGIDEFLQLQRDLPVYVQETVAAFNALQNEFGLMGYFNATEHLRSYIDRHTLDVFAYTVDAVRLGISMVILVPLFSFFFLIDGSRLQRLFIAQIPNRYFESTLTVSYEVHLSLGRFIRGRVYQMLSVFGLALVGFYIAGLPHAWLFALMVGISKLVPFLGIGVVALVVAFFALIVTHDWFFVLLMLSILGFVQMVDLVFLAPAFLRRRFSVHPAVGMVAIVLGGQLMGLVGMIIAIPCAAIVKIVALEVGRHFRGFAPHDQIGEDLSRA